MIPVDAVDKMFEILLPELHHQCITLFLPVKFLLAQIICDKSFCDFFGQKYFFGK